MIFQLFQSLTWLQVAFKLLKEPSVVLKLNKGVWFFFFNFLIFYFIFLFEWTLLMSVQ